MPGVSPPGTERPPGRRFTYPCRAMSKECPWGQPTVLFRSASAFPHNGHTRIRTTSPSTRPCWHGPGRAGAARAVRSGGCEPFVAVVVPLGDDLSVAELQE